MYLSMVPDRAATVGQQVPWGPNGWRLSYVAFWVQLVVLFITAQTGSMVGALAAFLLGLVLIAEGVLVFFNVGNALRAIEATNGPRIFAGPGIGRIGPVYFSHRTSAMLFALMSIPGLFAPWHLT
ncbi:MAG: hypothetical protein QOD50_1619 [Actinomycetota bacterium]|jgi:hypothetical protein|nr:hypothetical protein [Actinomycetota bacterium]